MEGNQRDKPAAGTGGRSRPGRSALGVVIGVSATLALLTLSAPLASAAKPRLSIADATAVEGGKVKFVVKLSKRAARKVSAAYATAPGSASSRDFVAAAGG
jgi:hypothetical protein